MEEKGKRGYMQTKFTTKKEVESINHHLINKMSILLTELYFRGPHAHKDIELTILLSGALHIETPEEKFDMGPLDVAYFNPAQPHECQTAVADSCRLLVLQFDPSFCVEYFPAMRNLFFETANLSRVIAPEQIHRLRSICYRAATNYFLQSTGFVFKCVSDLNLIMDCMLNHVPYKMIPEKAYLSTSNFEKRIVRIVSYIQDHYTEKITLQDIAEQEKLTTSYLSHLFKDHLHKSFQTFVNELRFERAVYLLKNTSMKIIDVCLESGFSDIKYLNRTFLSVFGVTPKEFRSQYLNGNTFLSAKNNTRENQIYDRKTSLSILSKLRQ